MEIEEVYRLRKCGKSNARPFKILFKSPPPKKKKINKIINKARNLPGWKI